MKKILATILSAHLLFGFAVCASALDWQSTGSTQQVSNLSQTAASDFMETSVFPNQQTAGVFEKVTYGFQPLVRLDVNQLKVSLLEITDLGEAFSPGGLFDKPPQLKFNTGIKTGNYLKPAAGVDPKISGIEADLEAAAMVMFVGVGLDFGPAFLNSNAFVGKSLEVFAPVFPSAGPSQSQVENGFDSITTGFEASAGYQINGSLALGAGVGRLNAKNFSEGNDAVIWAVYAQAILSLAPGIQVIPEFGQMELEEDTPGKNKLDAFWAGAKWEINF
ncbi:MAG: hypothetical protein JRH15_10870 [Deltaproteobacteria bacterium]|nr:hypothetical protein [Deltaproteobacteria bacterium]